MVKKHLPVTKLLGGRLHSNEQQLNGAHVLFA